MKYLYIIITLFAAAVTCAQNVSDKPLVIGNTHTLQSAILKERRTLNVYLPHGYDNAKSYSVIYVLDGSINEDFLHITGLVQFFTMTFNMPESIVVGIANTDRKKDFTHPTTDAALKKDYPTTGHSAAFIEFIEKELQPFVKSAYKTTGTSYIIGQSLGGLLASEILLKKPELFTHYLIVSPSLWWDNESLLNQAEAYLRKSAADTKYVYIAVGEGEHPQMISGAEKLSGLLRQLKPSVKTDFHKLKDENHATILHNSLYKAFALLFPYKG